MASLVLGASELFVRVNALLDGAGYDEQAIVREYGIPSMRELHVNPSANHSVGEPGSAAQVLMALFLEGRALDTATLDHWLPPGGREVLTSLGMLEPAVDQPEQLVATVYLACTRGVRLVSDRWAKQDGSLWLSDPDVVYPGHISRPQEFLDGMPDRSGDAALDLGTGSGVVALALAGRYTRVVATDINSRSVLFAEFNRRLNLAASVVTMEGDLYGPVHGETFDLIACHPPFMPVLKPRWVFYDGGEDGEQILRRVIAGLPRHLRRGGVAYLRGLVSDRHDAPAELRVREMLGEAHGEFDVALVVTREFAVDEFIERQEISGGAGATQRSEWRQHFAQLGVERLSLTAVVLQRHAEERAAFTVRRKASSHTGAAEHDWMLRWESMATRPEIRRAVLDAPLRAPAWARLSVRHRVQDGEWVPEHIAFRTEYPFEVRADCHPWMTALVAGCSEPLTARAHLERLQQRGSLGPDVTPDAFAPAVMALVSAGLLETDVCPQPRKAAAQGA